MGEVRVKKQDLTVIVEARGHTVEGMMKAGRQSIYRALESFGRNADIEFSYGYATCDQSELSGAAAYFMMSVTGVLHDVELYEPQQLELAHEPRRD